ncbi:MAG: DNA-directed RNA polymerase subunit beta' [Actinomycetota bacterium]|nr:DNA-directed RNA polymerase subunit beta' [Actinomycetota bacterium]
MDKVFDELSISLATSDQMRDWSYGEVKKPETINYRTLKPEKEGLFDERIFGPTKDWECSCGRYKRIRYRGIVCERCGVEVTRREVRRERLGHIELAAPVTHIWYFKGVPSRLGYFLDMSPKELEKVIYFAAYLIVSIDEKKRAKDLSELEEKVKYEVEIVNEEFEDWEKKRLKQMNTELKSMESGGVGKPEIQFRQKEVEKEIKDRKKKSDQEVQIIQDAFDRFKSLKPKELIDNDKLWSELKEEYGDYFEGGMGAEAVRDLISTVDLKAEMKKLETDLDSKSTQRRQRAIQRMKVIKPFADKKNPPEAMVLDVIPVIPPELRPMVQLDGGRFATSDLNDLYRRLINRNNRLKKLIELGAPDIIISNEKRMLQESVDALFDNGRRGRAVSGAGGRGLKSLSDMLKGKQGRFRQNLLGKRVDYSARSVIVVGPHLELQQCGLPKMMALELFKPFVMKRLNELGLAQNIKAAKRMVERSRAQVWDVLAEVILEHPVLLNRAPTLHRLGIQAFEPVLVEGKAIQVHPLVCEAFNADFDGDQMAVHVPLSAESQAEARVLMMSTNNVLSPASGHPIVSPSQDMVIGLYYLTECKSDLKDEEVIESSRAFSDVDEAELAYDNGEITLQTPIRIRLGSLAGDSDLHKELLNRFSDLLTDKPVHPKELVCTTLGRVYFNSILPSNFPYVQEIVRKTQMRKLISEVIERYNKAEVRIFLDSMKDVGFKFGTKAGLTVAINDVKTPPKKDSILKKYEDLAQKVIKQLNDGIITEAEKKKAIIEIWNEATEEVQDAMNEELQADLFNPVDMMVRSGARGNMMQVRQLAGMRGLVANPKGDIIESPIKSNFREGMSVLEYFISTHGARKGLADTALRTADSGYLTRRLVDVAAGIVIKDLGEENIDWKGTLKPVTIDGKPNRYLYSSIYGRVLAQDVKVDGKILVRSDGKKLTKGSFVDSESLEVIQNSGIENVSILSPFNSRNPESMDPQCYGFSLATGKPVEVGEAVGIISAQSIGEPGTQLTMRTFHTGGVVGLDITSGLPRIVELFEARTPKGKAVLAPIDGKIKDITTLDDGNRVLEIIGEKESKEVLVLRRQTLLFNQGDKVEAGISLTTGPKDPKEVLAINGVKVCQEYLVNEVQKTYRDQGVEVHDKHVEMIVRQMLRRVRIVRPNHSDFLPNELVDTTLFRNTNIALVEKGKVPAEGRPELMGITKASLATDSWLSAASFQETTRVLTEAAMLKRSDYLAGLKENVIIGTLIPAGTGSQTYQVIQPRLPDAPQVADLGFMSENTDEEGEEEALPNPAQWLAMLGEDDEGSPREEES